MAETAIVASEPGCTIGAKNVLNLCLQSLGKNVLYYKEYTFISSIQANACEAFFNFRHT